MYGKFGLVPINAYACSLSRISLVGNQSINQSIPKRKRKKHLPAPILKPILWPYPDVLNGGEAFHQSGFPKNCLPLNIRSTEWRGGGGGASNTILTGRRRGKTYRRGDEGVSIPSPICQYVIIIRTLQLGRVPRYSSCFNHTVGAGVPIGVIS